MIMLGNKCDMTEAIILSDKDIDQITDYCQVPCYKCSAFNGLGVDDGFMSIVQLGYTQ